MATQVITTIDDMILWYGSEEMALRTGLIKADDPILTTTTDSYAAHYGGRVFNQLNMERNIFSLFGKVPWGPEDGFRVLTAAPSTEAYGVAQGGAIPDTTRETYVQVNTIPRTMVTVFDSSHISVRAGARGQGITWEDRRDVMGQFHKRGIDNALGRDAEFVATNLLEFASVDQVVMSNNEYTNCTGHAGGAYAAADFDIYNITRSAGGAGNAWADATVLHNSSVDRNLTLSLINELERTVAENSGIYGSKNQIWLTGYDTYQAWGELMQTQQRFSEDTFELDTLNGVRTVSGSSGGFRVRSYNDKPIFVAQNLPDSAAGITPIYLLNLDFLKFWVDVPTVYYEAGMRSGTAQLLGKITDEGMYLTMGQLICTFFSAQGKLRDLQ